MYRVVIYKGHNIRVFERKPDRWRAEIRKADGSQLSLALEGGGSRDSISTSADTLSANAALDLAKQAIDGEGLW